VASPSAAPLPAGALPPQVASGGAGLVAHVVGLLPSLTPAEQRVARLVMADPAGVAARTVTDLAIVAGTSEATVIRFCRAVGVDGYPQLRLRLAADAGRRGARAEAAGETAPLAVVDELPPDAGLGQLAAAIAAEHAWAAWETAARLDPTGYATVVAAISAAARVEVHGAGESGLAGAELRRRLQLVGVPAYGWPDGPTAVASAGLLGPGDVALAFSDRGQAGPAVDVLRRARDRGARTVAVTTFPRSPLARTADVLLVTVVRESAERAGVSAALIAQLTVIDCLTLGVTRARVPQLGD
jgi:DNA-binding MurR/RpiR family transcriptional regulator